MIIKHLALAGAVVAASVFAADALARKPDNPGKPDKSMYGKARSPLVRPADGPEGNRAKGRIDVMSRKNGSDLRIMGQRLDEGFDVDILVGNETIKQTLRTNDEGSVKLMLRTRKGDELDLAALAGERVHLRASGADDGEPDLLTGVIPAINADYPSRVRERADLDPVDGADCSGRIQVSFRSKDVRSEIRIDVKGATEGDDVVFRMEDEFGEMQDLATVVANADGEATYRVRTHHGEELPFGVLTVFDLAERDIEVSVNPLFEDEDEDPNTPDVDVNVCLTGSVPVDPLPLP